MAAGFPDRMKYDFTTAVDLLYKAERYGQKNGAGFYRYETDKRGKLKKMSDAATADIIKSTVVDQVELSDEQILERMMIPMCIETVRCLDEGIVGGPADADIGLIYGIGFPPFRGGVLHYMDTIGMSNFCAMCDKYTELGDLYRPTASMRAMAADGKSFFGRGA